jgi:pyruvate dehydrogenase E1 component
MGEAGEGMNITHQQHEMGEEALKAFRDRFNIPVSDDEIAAAPFYMPAEDSPELAYLHERRRALGGYLPVRRTDAEPLEVPSLEVFDALVQGSGEREVSTTMAAVRILQLLTRDKKIGRCIVPIVPDESRTFGMEGMFRRLGIYSSVGQLYEPVDSDQVSYYREDKQGQILQEGINEAGAFASWMAAGTSYSNHGINMVPFYIYYSMFGFQRIGDLAWAAGDMQVRGFLLGGTAGRTTLAGEGLQHQDGHSHVLASTIPNCRSYDPAYAYELAVIVHDGLRRMFVEQEDVFYYLTVMNEKYVQPPMPADSEAGILKGMHLVREAGDDERADIPRVQLLGSGTVLREVLAAADMLEQDFSVSSDVWSVTSFTELARDGYGVERWNRLHPEGEQRLSFVERQLARRRGPAVAASDYMRSYAEQIRPLMRGSYRVLGTDGFGRSDSRDKLRQFFEVDRSHICVAALTALADEGEVERSRASEAIRKYGIDPAKPDPTTL